MRTSAILILSLAALAAAELTVPSTADRPPRKVIVGTAMQRFWGEYPGLQKRLEQLTALVDQMSEESRQQYGRDLDLAILPETSVTGETSHDVMADAVPLQGALQDTFARKAREHHCYIVIPTYLLEDKGKKLCSNAAILMGRSGEVIGIYRKVHLAVHTASDSLEGGTTPGKESFPMRLWQARHPDLLRHGVGLRMVGISTTGCGADRLAVAIPADHSSSGARHRAPLLHRVQHLAR